MENLFSITEFVNQSVESIKLEANCFYLIRVHVTNNGDVKTYTINMGAAKDDRAISAVKAIMAAQVAFLKVSNAILTDKNGVEEFKGYESLQEMGVKCKNPYQTYLKGNTIYKTDSNGHLLSAATSEIRLADTALRVSPKDEKILTANSKDTRAMIHNRALGASRQFTIISDLRACFDAIVAEAKEAAAVKEEKVVAVTEVKVTAKKATKKAAAAA